MRSVPVILKSTSRFSRVAIWAISLPCVLVVGDRRPPVAVDGEAREQRILFTQQGAALVVCAGRVLLAAQLKQRARRLDRGFGAVDVDLPLGIVVGFVLRIGSEKIPLAVLVAAGVLPVCGIASVFFSGSRLRPAYQLGFRAGRVRHWT